MKGMKAVLAVGVVVVSVGSQGAEVAPRTVAASKDQHMSNKAQAATRAPAGQRGSTSLTADVESVHPA